MALRELLLELGVDVKDSDVKKADGALSKLKKAALAAAAAFVSIKAVQGIGNLVDGVRGLGDEIDKTSQQLGLGVEELQEWRFAAGLAGVAGQEMSNSLGRLQKNAFEAAKGNKTLAEDFKRLGVNVKDADGNLKNADTLLTEMADGFQGLTNDSEKVALALNLMGRTGRKLLPLFKDGASGIAEMRKEAQSLGGIMDQDLIDATVRLTDDQFRAQQAWQGFKNQIAGKIIPVFIKLANFSLKIAKSLRGPLTKALEIVGVAFNVLKGLILAIVNIVETTVGVFDELIDTFGKTIVALGSLGLAMVIFGVKSAQAAAATLIGWVLALAPLLLMAALVAAVILLFDDIITFFKGGDSLIGRLIDRFKDWVKEMGGFGGIVKSIFKSLFKTILGVSDETAGKIVDFFSDGFADIKAAVVGLGTDIGEGFAKAFLFVTDFVDKFKKAFTEAIDFLIDKFNALTDTVVDFIAAAAEATGLDAFVDKGAQVDIQQERKNSKERKRLLQEDVSRRIRIFQQLEREGFGTFSATAGKGGGAGLTGAKAGAQERFAQIAQQQIDASVTVNVDATGQTDRAGIARKTATEVSRVNNARQVGNTFSTQASGG